LCCAKSRAINSLAWDSSVAIVLIKIMELWLVITDNYINTIRLTSYMTLASDPAVIVSRDVVYITSNIPPNYIAFIHIHAVCLDLSAVLRTDSFQSPGNGF
jgi:hypothetical protein